MNDAKSELIITPDTRLGILLDTYPQLESVLTTISPAFAKLKNPLLRKTVAKIATLHQVSQIGNIPIGNLINTLRAAVGQAENFVPETDSISANGSPEWFDSTRIKKSLDARPILDRGEHPLSNVVKDLAELKSDEIYELITPFHPAPLIDTMKSKGFQAWSRTDGDLIKTYFKSE